MTRRFRRWISQSWTNHTRNWDGDFRYWNGQELQTIEKNAFLNCGKLEKIQKSLKEASKEDFTMSFSYGVVEYDSREEGINRKVRMKTCIG